MINSRLMRGNLLQLGGPQFCYGPPLIPATPGQFILWDSTPGTNDAELEIHGELIVRSDFTCDGDVIIGGTASADDPSLPGHLATKLYVDTAIASIDFSGDVASTVQAFLSDSAGAVRIRDDQGLSVANTAGVEANRLRTLSGTTTNALPVALTAGAGQHLAIAPGAAHSYTITVTGKATFGPDTGKAYCVKLEFVATNSAGTVATLGGVWKSIIGHSGVNWNADIVEDSPNGRVTVVVTGELGSTIVWVGRVSETAL